MLAKQKLTNDYQADGLADVYLFILSKRRQRLVVEKEATHLESLGKETRNMGNIANNNKGHPRTYLPKRSK